ncbi:MAG TPA: DEAD/DEAH box helicase [Anaerolineaceae bacterium]|nr:DEAD/DEAH box helicase [Anaerolineaceae bacterium]
MVSDFEDLGLSPQYIQAIEQLGFEQPTPIQQAAIPALLGGHDVVGQAQTGTGKTAAFGLPMLQKIQPGKGKVQAVVLAPTRELAIQVAEAIGKLGQHTQVRILPVYGGQSYQVQIQQLKRGVDVVVGTPGRMLDLIEKKLLDLSQVSYLVLDEADEMLAMGFIEDVETILAQMQGERQTSLFSATLPDAIRKLAAKYMKDSQEIRTSPKQITVAETEQRFCQVRQDKKISALGRFLEVEEVTSALIFARTKLRAQELADELNRRGYPAESLHGDLNQARREFVLDRFRNHTIKLLVATDVAARGLDIENVSHVFNYDVPADAEDYVHRIGRTGRAGRKGIAVTFLTARERYLVNQFEAFTRQKMTEIQIPTREEVLSRRDDRFIKRLTGRLASGKISRERGLIAKLTEANIDLVEIAAAAIQLARAGEIELPKEEILAAAVEQKSARISKRKFVEEAIEEPFRAGRKSKKAPAGVGQLAQADALSKAGRYNKRNGEAGMVRLKMNLGGDNGLRPSDVVGAIASEVGIPGRAIGVIDIRKDYTFVDVSEKHVHQVLQESTGQYFLHGKPVLLKLAN